MGGGGIVSGEEGRGRGGGVVSGEEGRGRGGGVVSGVGGDSVMMWKWYWSLENHLIPLRRERGRDGEVDGVRGRDGGGGGRRGREHHT